MTRSLRRALSAAALLLLAAVPFAPSAEAAVLIPTKLTDSADGACDRDCSLREAVLAANAAEGYDVILLDAGTYILSLPGPDEDLAATGDLDVRDDLAIVGKGASNTLLDADRLDRLLDVAAGDRLELRGVTLRRGWIASGSGGGIRVRGELDLELSVVTANEAAAGSGGGIAVVGEVDEGAALRLDRSTVWGNQALTGGGLYVESVLHMTNSTISGNSALAGGGGGIHATDDASGTVSSSTITSNQAAQRGGGVLVETTPFISVVHPTFKNTILAGNTGSPASDADCSGAALSEGHNLLGVGEGCPDFGPFHGDLEGTVAAPLDPVLLPLSESGNLTPVHLPGDRSPVLGHGSDCEPVDQRGVDRSEVACEIGSVEITSQCIEGGGDLCLHHGRFKVDVAWGLAGDPTREAQGVELTDESGYFWFFSPSNLELTIKVLNGCHPNGRFWVFMSGLTNVGVTVTVTDTKTGQVKTYRNPANRNFAPIFDTNAFATCP